MSKRREERKEESKKESLHARVCLVVTRGAFPFNRWLDSPTHSFIHTRCTRFESISKPRKRIFPIGLATAALNRASTRNSSRSLLVNLSVLARISFQTKAYESYSFAERKIFSFPISLSLFSSLSVLLILPLFATTCM